MNADRVRRQGLFDRTAEEMDAADGLVVIGHRRNSVKAGRA